MSVQSNTYVIYGVVLPYEKISDFSIFDDYTDSAFDGNMNPKDGITALVDGMSGNYVAVGIAIEKARQEEGFLNPVEIGFKPDGSNVEYAIAAMYGLIKQAMGEEYVPQPKWYVISHYR